MQATAGIEDAVVVLGNRKRPAEIGFGDGLEDHGEQERRLGKVALDHQVADVPKMATQAVEGGVVDRIAADHAQVMTMA